MLTHRSAMSKMKTSDCLVAGPSADLRACTRKVAGIANVCFVEKLGQYCRVLVHVLRVEVGWESFVFLGWDEGMFLE